YEHARGVRAFELQRNQRVHARVRSQNLHQRFRIDRDRLALTLLAAVQHRRNLAIAPQTAGVVAAESIAANCLNGPCHVSPALARGPRPKAKVSERSRLGLRALGRGPIRTISRPTSPRECS